MVSERRFALRLIFFSIPQAVTLHTDLGDIKIELNCELIPKACEVCKASYS